MAVAGLALPMDEPALPDLYARYQSAVWDSCRAWAEHALTDPVEVRRATARRFVRTCLSYAAWTARQAPPAGASHALVARVAVA